MGVGEAAKPLVVTFMAPVNLTETARARLEAAAPQVEIHVIPYQEDAALRNARSTGKTIDALLAQAPVLSAEDWAALERTNVAVALDLPAGMLERARSLQWVQTISAGTEHLDVAGLAARDVLVTSGAGLSAAPIAEFVMGRLLQVWKHFRVLDERQSAQRWEPLYGQRMAGRTLGIVGLGAIGRATARRARAFGMRVVANRRSAAPGAADPDVDELFTADGLDEMIGRCDAVVISVAATSETTGLFDRHRINFMKPGAVLCNVARGSLVDEDAVVAALRSGHLSAAVLDVTAQEPTPVDSPLWTAPNCYLSAHTAVSLEGYQDAALDLVVLNLGRLARGERLENLVDPSTRREHRR
jgi:phosphoglycerate dehydrogenase-like enzyme